MKLAENPKASEALVTMLVLRLRPRAQEVDGAGGDGGRDLLEYTESGELINYEAKSFTGRMTSGRRQQVVGSLISTARHQPDHWDLLVPISPNPNELAWFAGLRREFPFVRDWRGLNWLNQQFAAHQDLIRYALQESGDYILDRIAEARAERDTLLRGIPDLAARYRALHMRAQEISPGYAIRTVLGPDGETAIHLLPKADNTQGTRPIRFTGRVSFRRNEPQDEQRREQFEEAIRFGGEVELAAANLEELTVDAPSELGISGSFPLESLKIAAHREALSPAMRGQLMIRTPAGGPTASLPVEFTQRVTGFDGGSLFGQDITGFIRIQMRYDRRREAWSQTLSFAPPETSLPQEMVPVLRFISRAVPGQSMELTIHGPTVTQLTAPITQTAVPDSWNADEAETWADAFDYLATLQRMTGQFFATPPGYTLKDARDARNAVSLLRGEKVDMPNTVVAVGVDRIESLEQVSRGKLAFAAKYQAMVVTFGEHQIDLGPGIELMTIDKVLNMREARQALADEGHATVRLKLDRTQPAQRYLGTDLPSPGTQP
ncbi:hypothetical protein [Streptomyces sp. NBC_00347]|uniref:hypothetical protein n=1 Tax=Streptomyces sp. NBC_00347 TaxID=2975721 RepID=UPI0022587D84|nr:hypothetical protein [Streptomyces sp. NBC_00347]